MPAGKPMRPLGKRQAQQAARRQQIQFAVQPVATKTHVTSRGRVVTVDQDTGEVMGEPRATGRPLVKTGRYVVMQSEDVRDDCVFLRYTPGQNQPGGLFGSTPSRLVEILVNKNTWDTLQAHPAGLGDFLADMSREGKAMGLQMLVADTGAGEAKGYYHEAQLARARQGSNPSPKKDRLEALTEDLNALVVQAASLNTRATPVQQKMFAERLGELQERWEELSRDIKSVEALVEFATVAVIEAA